MSEIPFCYINIYKHGELASHEMFKKTLGRIMLCTLMSLGRSIFGWVTKTKGLASEEYEVYDSFVIDYNKL